MDPGRRPKVYYPRVNPLQRFSDEKFIARYRLSKDIVQLITDDYVNSDFCTSKCGRRGGGLSGVERMCLALRYFATGANYSVIGDFQGVSKSTVSKCVREVSRFFFHNVNEFVIFPRTFLQRQEKAREFYRLYGEKPLCMGCLDGTHIPILRPHDNDAGYTNRKGYQSLNVLVISDANHLITHIDARYAGSAHDAYVFQRSRVARQAERGHFGDFYFLGDSGYPLKKYLLTPKRTIESPADERYNDWHMRTRATVEQTFGIMKQRFRCVDDSGGYLYHDPATCIRIIVTCACLHNLALQHGMPAPIDEREEDEDGRRPDNQQFEQPPCRMPIAQPRQELVRRRQQFIDDFFQE